MTQTLFYKRNILQIKMFIFLLILMLYSLNIVAYNLDRTNAQNDSINLKLCLDSTIKYKLDNYNKAYHIAINALNKYNPSNNVIDRISLLQNIAFIEYYFKNDFYNSIIHLNAMRNLSDSIGYKRGLPWVQLNMGNLYYYQNDLIKSMELLKNAKKNAEIINDSIIIIDALTGIADILFHNNKIDSALLYINQSLDFAIRNNLLNTQFYLYDDIANISKRSGKYDTSYFYYKKTLEVSKKNNNKFGIMCTEVNLAYVNFLKNNKFNAIPVLEDLQKQAKIEGFFRLYYEIGYTISEILENRGKFQESLTLYKRTRFIEDSIKANDKIRKVSELEANYYLKKKEFENNELIKLNEIKSLKLKNRLNLICLISFIVIQLIVLLYIIYKKYITIKEHERKIYYQDRLLFQQEKETINQKLQLRERETTSNVMKIYHHNRLIQKIITDIRNIKTILTSEEVDVKKIQEKLQSMINRLKISDNKQMWNEFEKSFIETNPEFIEKITAKYPDLTPNEIKLSIFLFMNLRTKDISVITQQNIRSINTARTRLRKKLNLHNTNSNLSSFLQQI